MEHQVIKVGDVLPAIPRGAIFEPGLSRWYALRVAPQREDQAEIWLRQRGVYSFHPVLARTSHRCGVPRVYHRRYLPGYVFARFQGDPLQHRVMSCPWIIGALCRTSGDWGVLEHKKLSAIHAMRKIDAEQRMAKAAARALKLADARVRAGDSVMFRNGPLAGFRGEVVDLVADGGAVIRFEMFGREAIISSAPAELIPLRKAG